MTHWNDAIHQLERLFEHERIGIVTDMDGTISHVVGIPTEAQPTPRNVDLLRQLHDILTLVAVVSGRAADDLRQRVGLPQLVYVGNHGLERWQDDRVVVLPDAQQFLPAVQRVLQAVEHQILPGMWIEDKGVTVSFHYRNSPDPQHVIDTFRPLLDRAAEKEGLRTFGGRMIFELRPPLEIDKGTIFRHLIEDYRLDAVLFLGDDTTDADAMKVAQQLRRAGNCYALAVGVTSEETPPVVLESSDLLAQGVDDVEALLDWLLKAASAS